MQNVHSREEVERALARILADDKFACAPQMSAFLAYVVRETLEGRAERIKAYTIGIEALGKPESFDSQTDPSVRVLAKRLRTCLTGYHERHPEADPVIEIRPGCYRPLFLTDAGGAHGRADPSEDGSARAPTPPRSWPPPDRTVTAFTEAPPRRARPTSPTVRVPDAHRPGSSSAALTAVAVGALARAEGIRVIRHARDEAMPWPEDYALSLEAIESDAQIRVELQLVHCADGLVVHALTCRVDLVQDEPEAIGERLPASVIEAVEAFVCALARHDGELFDDYRARRGSTAERLRPSPERPLALEAARHGSPLADAA